MAATAATAQSISVGWSGAADALTAGQQAARIALAQLEPHRPACGIVFGSSWFDQYQLIKGVRGVLKTVPFTGGSTAGEITPEGPKSHSCVVMLIADDPRLRVAVGIGQQLHKDSRLAGYHAAQQAVKQLSAPRSGFVFFGDGLVSGAYSEALRGMQEVLGTSSLVTGALMADDLQFANTYQYANGQVYQQALAGALIGGACKLGVGIEHGFFPISKPRRITKAHGNVLDELDGQPASSVYEEYFGPTVKEAAEGVGLTRWLIAYPLGIQQETSRQFLLRNVMAFGDRGSLVCTGDVPDGAWAQLMIGSKELALEAASLATQQAIRSLQHIWFALIFESAIRKRLLGREAASEIARIRSVLGPHVPFAGGYTYGEQAPRGGVSVYGQSALQTGACLVIAVGQ